LLAFESALDDRNRVLREISEALLAVLRPSRRRDSFLWRRKAEAQIAQLPRPTEPRRSEGALLITGGSKPVSRVATVPNAAPQERDSSLETVLEHFRFDAALFVRNY
jgi:hypothetical protein